MKTTLYGIRSCDTMHKARAWLDARGISHVFHDYKIAGIETAVLQRWAGVLGWETLLNRAGTTFRKLPEADRMNLTAAKAIALMRTQPSLIKRPVLEHGAILQAGFKPDRYGEIFPRNSI